MSRARPPLPRAIGGEKGGVGKSVVARVLAQAFLDRGLSFVAVDADISHGAMLRYYGDYAHRIDLESLASADQIMDRAFGADRRVLVDLPAQSARHLERWMNAGDVVNYAEQMDVRLVLWHVTDGGFESVNDLQRTVDVFGTQLRYVVVKNYGRSQDFSQLDESAAFKAVLEHGGKSVNLPQLDTETMYKIDRFGSSFWAAVNSSEGEWALSAMARRRAKRWLELSYAELAAVDDML